MERKEREGEVAHGNSVAQLGKASTTRLDGTCHPTFLKKDMVKLIKYYVRTQTMSLIVAPVCGSDDSLSERVAPRSSLPSIGILLYLPSEAAGEKGIMFNVFAKRF